MRTLSPPWRRVLVGSWVMILTLGVATLILYVDNKRTRDCIANYMVADQRAAQVRANVAEQERQYFKEVLKTVTDPSKPAVVRKASLDGYITLLDRNDQVRKSNPIPQVPTGCS